MRLETIKFNDFFIHPYDYYILVLKRFGGFWRELQVVVLRLSCCSDGMIDCLGLMMLQWRGLLKLLRWSIILNWPHWCKESTNMPRLEFTMLQWCRWDRADRNNWSFITMAILWVSASQTLAKFSLRWIHYEAILRKDKPAWNKFTTDDRAVCKFSLTWIADSDHWCIAVSPWHEIRSNSPYEHMNPGVYDIELMTLSMGSHGCDPSIPKISICVMFDVWLVLISSSLVC